MGNRSSLLLRKEEIAQIRNETGCKLLEPIALSSILFYFLYILA